MLWLKKILLRSRKVGTQIFCGLAVLYLGAVFFSEPEVQTQVAIEVRPISSEKVRLRIFNLGNSSVLVSNKINCVSSGSDEISEISLDSKNSLFVGEGLALGVDFNLVEQGLIYPNRWFVWDCSIRAKSSLGELKVATKFSFSACSDKEKMLVFNDGFPEDEGFMERITQFWTSIKFNVSNFLTFKVGEEIEDETREEIERLFVETCDSCDFGDWWGEDLDGDSGSSGGCCGFW